MWHRSVVFLIILGSVFATSDRFVDPEIAAKFYFAMVAVPVGIIVLIFGFGKAAPASAVKKITSLSALKCFFAVGVFQAVYGLGQYVGLCPLKNVAHPVLGSFDNPAGFAAVLSLLFPIGCYWFAKSRGHEKWLSFLMTAIVFASVCLSGSRTGILSLFVSMILTIAVGFRPSLNMLPHKKTLFALTFVVFLTVLFCLYRWRMDSANGRLLIWTVSNEMIKDRPLFGFGPNGFQAHYMDYQARYFQANPMSGFSQLADNVRHPFNEFVKIAVNYGITGLLAYLSLLLYIVWKILEKPLMQKNILLSVFAVFVLWSCFSYPMAYSTVLLLLAYFSLALFSDRFPPKKLSTIGKVAITGLCITCSVYFYRMMSYEVAWKKVAMKSLNGQTEAMLPEYQKLYPRLRHNALFLYNYGAELNIGKRYAESAKILSECRAFYNDYDIEMLMADNHYRLDNVDEAIQAYQYAADMIPCRFLPLFRQFEIHKRSGNAGLATAIAQQMVNKSVKVRSPTVMAMVCEAKAYL